MYIGLFILFFVFVQILTIIIFACSQLIYIYYNIRYVWKKSIYIILSYVYISIEKCRNEVIKLFILFYTGSQKMLNY